MTLPIKTPISHGREEMEITEIEKLYEYTLQQMAAESYLEDSSRLSDRDYLVDKLTTGTNRAGFTVGTSDDLNQGWPGFTRMTESQAFEFLSKYKIVHQWSDNPCTKDGEQIAPRPAIDYVHDRGLLLNGPDMLANTGLSATLIRKLDAFGHDTNEYTLAIRSTEFRDWDKGGDGERDTYRTDPTQQNRTRD